MAVTPSAGQPTSASSSSSARCPSWDRVVSAMARRPVDQPLHELFLDRAGVVVGDLAGLSARGQQVELPLDVGRVEPLPLGLLLHLLGHPDGAAHRSERPRHQPGDQSRDQAHDRSFCLSWITTWSRKAYGGWGPTYRSSTWPANRRSSSLTAASTRSRSARRTRSATLATS